MSPQKKNKKEHFFYPFFGKQPCLPRVFLSLLILSSQAWANITETPVINLSDLLHTQNITPYTKVIEDNNDYLNHKNINLPYIKNQFEQTNQPVLHKGFTRNSVWLKFGLYNDLSSDQTVHMEIQQLNPTNLVIYKEGAKSQLERYIEPKKISLKKLGPALQQFIYPIQMLKDEKSIIYLKYGANFPVNTKIFLHPHESKPITNINYFILGVVISGLFLACTLIAYMYYRFGDLTTLYFSLLCGTIALYLFFWLNGPRNLLLHNDITQHTDVITVTVCTILMILFTKNTIPEKYISKNRTRIFLFLLAGALPSIVTFLFFSTHLSLIIAISYSIISMILLSYVTLMAFLMGSKNVGWLLNGFVILTIMAIIDTLFAFNLLPFNIESFTITVLASAYFIISSLINIISNPDIRFIPGSDDGQSYPAVPNKQEQYISNLSHQVRTPLSGILGMTELLEDSSLSPNQKNYLSTIKSSANTLTNLINDVVDGFRLEIGTIIINSNPFDITKMLNDCVEIFRAEITDRGMELLTFIDSEVPWKIIGDEARIKQIITSAITAILSDTDTREITISIKPEQHGDMSLRFEINGLRTLMNSKDPDYNRILPVHGMQTSEKLIALMGGKAGIETLASETFQIWFSLPLQAALKSTSTPDINRIIENMRILVIDDNSTVTKVIVEQARNRGMDATGMENAKEALALVKNQANLGQAFDVIIVDHEMPDMTGLELTARLKEDPLITDDVIIIMLTGLNIAPSSTMARNAGIRRILTKPVTGDSLLIAIAEEIERMTRLKEQTRTAISKNVEMLSNEPINVLVAEDHRLSQKVISGMLNRLGINFELVENGALAVSRFKQHDYDLVLMDCEMPELNGFEATKSIRSWEKENDRSKTPIIALTAHILDDNEKLSAQAGMDSYISKPVELTELRNLISNWTQKRTAEFTDL